MLMPKTPHNKHTRINQILQPRSATTLHTRHHLPLILPASKVSYGSSSRSCSIHDGNSLLFVEVVYVTIDMGTNAQSAATTGVAGDDNVAHCLAVNVSAHLEELDGCTADEPLYLKPTSLSQSTL